jgi:hypothetical protein
MHAQHIEARVLPKGTENGYFYARVELRKKSADAGLGGRKLT